MNFGRKVADSLKFGKKVIGDAEKFGKKVSRETKKATRQYATDTKKFANKLERGAKKVDDFNLYVPLLNDAKGVVSSGMRNVGSTAKWTGKAGLVASDLTRGDLIRAKSRSNELVDDSKQISADVAKTLAKGKDVYGRSLRLAAGDPSALFV